MAALEAPTGKHTGITVAELGRRAITRRLVRFTGLDLARWLLHEGLAEVHDGALIPTRRGAELGELLSDTRG